MDRHLVVNETERPDRSREQGNTLIEVLVAGVLIAIFVVALFQVISQGSLLNRQQILRRRAYQVLDSVLESPTNSSLSPNYLARTTGDPVDTMTVALDYCGNSAHPDTINAAVKVNVDTVSYSYSGTVIPAKKVTAIISYSDQGNSYQDSLQTLSTLAGIN